MNYYKRIWGYFSYPFITVRYEKSACELKCINGWILRLYVNGWGGIRQNPTPLLTPEPFLYTDLIHPVFGHAK